MTRKKGVAKLQDSKSRHVFLPFPVICERRTLPYGKASSLCLHMMVYILKGDVQTIG